MLLSEDLAKQDTAFESSANKLVDVIRSLLGAEAATKLAGSLSVNESKKHSHSLKVDAASDLLSIGTLTIFHSSNHALIIL